MKIQQKNNTALLRGQVCTLPEFSHSVHELCFYRFMLCVPRLSGAEDQLPILVSEEQLSSCPLTLGARIEVEGEVRSFNNRSGTGSRLLISLFARALRQSQEEFCNVLQLRGTLCKEPTKRRTPLGREICDLLLAVNRSYRRADYLPCIAWGSLANFCAGRSIGDELHINGRLQSRHYVKTQDEVSQERIAFEISIMSIAPQEADTGINSADRSPHRG